MYLEAEPTASPDELQRHRLDTLDVYRGLALAALLIASVNRDWATTIAEAFPDSWLAQFVATQATPSAWTGATLADLVQPAFLFAAGMALTYSCNRRSLFGQSYGAMFLHSLGRSALLVFLGIFLASNGVGSTQWTFVNPLTQIGLGYVFVFLLWDRGWKLQGTVALVILVLTWMRFAMADLPPADFDWSIAKGEGWQEPLTGFAAHWNKNANPSHYFDLVFLNGFSRTEPFLAHPGGVQTLNFIPSLVVMILGMMAGDCVRVLGRTWETVKILAISGVVGLFLGVVLDASGICPLVKRIWTPGFVFYSTGWCLLFFAGLFSLIDLLGLKKPGKPLSVLGMNSITVFLLLMLVGGWIQQTLRTHLGAEFGTLFGAPFQPLVENLVIGALIGGIAWFLFHRRIFVRI